MRLWLLSLVLALATACAHRKLAVEAQPSPVVYKCPDDGIHFVDAYGNCVGYVQAPHRPRFVASCPNDGHHELVNGVCVDLMGK